MYVLTYPCVCRYTCVGGRVCTDVHGKVEAMGHPWVLYPSRTPPCLLTLFFPDKSMNHLYYNFLFLSYISFSESHPQPSQPYINLYKLSKSKLADPQQTENFINMLKRATQCSLSLLNFSSPPCVIASFLALLYFMGTIVFPIILHLINLIFLVLSMMCSPQKITK